MDLPRAFGIGDEFFHTRGIDQDFHGRNHALLIGAGHQPLRNDALEHRA